MTRLVIISLVALAGCHEPIGRINSGTDGPPTFSGGSGLQVVSTAGAGGREAPTIITGTDGDDFLVGTPGPDVINGGAGDDVICGDPECGALFEELKRRGL